MFTSVKGSSMTSRRQINLKIDIFSETIVLAARWGMTPRVCYSEPVIIDDAMTLWHANTQNTASLIPFTHLRPHSRISGLIHAHQTNSLGCSAHPPRGRIYGGCLRQKARHCIFRSFIIASTCIALLIVEQGEERRGGNKWQWVSRRRGTKWRKACDCVLVLVARWWNRRDWILFLWVSGYV
jgi:hypothetical protein